MILKLVGFILFNDYNPDVEKNIGWKYKPDLIAYNKKGDVVLWVECADVTVKKIHRVLKKFKSAKVVILKFTQREAEQYYSFFEEKGTYPENLSTIGFDEEFIDELCNNVKDRIHIESIFEDNKITMSWENFSGESCVYQYGN